MVSSVIQAHPHMFMDSRLRIYLDGSELTGLEITWFFDPFFTAAVLTDYDANRNGTLETSEISSVRDNAFSNLANFSYFTFVTTAEGTFSPSRIDEFTAFMSGDTLVYRFYAPFDLPIVEGRFAVAIYDESFYCDMLYHPQNPVEISGRGSETASWCIHENRDIQISYGGSVSVSREDGSYSGTAYPQQIVVTLSE